MIETERLLIREIRKTDLKALCAVFMDEENMRFYPYQFDEQRLKNRIRANLENYQVYGFGMWVVCLKENGLLIGDCGITIRMEQNLLRPRISFHIRRDMQQQGYGREAVRAVCNWVFQRTPFRRLYCYLDINNKAAVAICQGIGMKQAESFQGNLKDTTYVYQLERDTWDKHVKQLQRGLEITEENA